MLVFTNVHPWVTHVQWSEDKMQESAGSRELKSHVRLLHKHLDPRSPPIIPSIPNKQKISL